MRVNIVSTYPPTNCGIAIYSSYFIDSLRKLCEVGIIPIRTPTFNPLYILKLAMTGKKNVDIVHVQFDCGFFGTASIGRLSLSGMYAPLFYFAVKALKGPAVITTLHEIVDVKKAYGGRIIYWPMRIYYSILYGSVKAMSDAVIAHTADTVKTLSQYTKVDNARIIPLACYVDPVFLPQAECKAKLGMSGKRMITMFGFIHPLKGHDIAIDVIKDMPPDTVLYIAGDVKGQDKSYLDTLIEKVRTMGLEGRVKFHGYVKDEEAPVVMCASDIILLPYRHVVQSAALSFSLSYGKPVLASDIGGFAEVAKEYGCIETFDLGNVEDMRSQLMRMLSDPLLLEKLREKARAYSSNVCMDSITARTLELYHEVTYKKPNA